MISKSSQAEIEETLARKGYRLAFSPNLEAAFRDQRRPLHTRSIQHFLMVAGAFDLVGALCDLQARIPTLRLALGFRLGIYLPLLILCGFLLGRTVCPWLRGLIAVMPMIAGTVLVGTLARVTGGAMLSKMLLLPGLTIFAQTLIAPVPFRYALRGLLVSLAVFASFCVLSGHGSLAWQVDPAILIFISGISLAALYERGRREAADRKDFLLGELNALRLANIVAMNAHLERLSSMDGLTGVFNRRYLDAALARLWMVAADHERWIGVLMVDIDHFKALNDTLGHQYGDMCLEQVAGIIQAGVRAGVDTVARYGGEEFIAILPEADEADVLRIGERIRSGIEEAQLAAPEGTVVTISAGAAAVHGGRSSALSLEEFIAAADQALYEAKRSGRNRIVCTPLLAGQTA